MTRAPRPVHPLLLSLPLFAFAASIAALVGHALGGNEIWYEVALGASAVGLACALLAAAIDVVDASNLPAHTVARGAGLRHVAFSALGLIFFAASTTVMFTRYESHHLLGDAAPLALGALGLAAMIVAGWYGRAVLRLFELGQAIVRYPAARRARVPAPPHPRATPTIG